MSRIKTKFKTQNLHASAKSRVERAADFSKDCKVVLTFRTPEEFDALGKEIIARNLENVALRAHDEVVRSKVLSGVPFSPVGFLPMKSAKRKPQEKTPFALLREHKMKMARRKVAQNVVASEPANIILRAIRQLEEGHGKSCVQLFANNHTEYLALVRERHSLADDDPRIVIRMAHEREAQVSAPAMSQISGVRL